MFGVWPSGGQQLSLAQTAQEGFPDFPDNAIRKGKNSAPGRAQRGQGKEDRKAAPRAKAFSTQSPEWNEPATAPPGLRPQHFQEPTTNFGAGLEVGSKPRLHLWVMERPRASHLSALNQFAQVEGRGRVYRSHPPTACHSAGPPEKLMLATLLPASFRWVFGALGMSSAIWLLSFTTSSSHGCAVDQLPPPQGWLFFFFSEKQY